MPPPFTLSAVLFASAFPLALSAFTVAPVIVSGSVNVFAAVKINEPVPPTVRPVLVPEPVEGPNTPEKVVLLLTTSES